METGKSTLEENEEQESQSTAVDGLTDRDSRSRARTASHLLRQHPKDSFVYTVPNQDRPRPRSMSTIRPSESNPRSISSGKM